MILEFEERPSDSPLVERIWRNTTERSGEFTSIATGYLQMCIWTQEGKTNFTLRGPETKPSQAFAPPDTEFLGIVFKLGSYMPQFPLHTIIDGNANLPDANNHSFWLQGGAWEFPNYDNVETFVDRLVHDGLLVYEPIIDTAMRGHLTDLSPRSIQRKFLQATGMTQGAASQIERARQATLLLRQGVSINDTVDLVSYADQPHLTRSLRRYIGFTPAQISRNNPDDELSFLFKTPSSCWDTIYTTEQEQKE